MDYYRWGVIILLILMIGCAPAKTTLINPKGDVWIVHSKKDALVILKQDGIEFTVDNRGKVGWIEGLMQYILAKPDIKLSNKEGN